MRYYLVFPEGVTGVDADGAVMAEWPGGELFLRLVLGGAPLYRDDDSGDTCIPLAASADGRVDVALHDPRAAGTILLQLEDSLRVAFLRWLRRC